MKKTKATIKHFEDVLVLLETNEGSFKVPKGLLPENVNEGGIVFVNINTEKEEEKNREESAKDVLNEVLRQG